MAGPGHPAPGGQAAFPITSDAAANELLVTDPFALIVGMLFDQQVAIEWAFYAPFRLRQRLGDRFTPGAIAAMDPDELVAVSVAKPAVHRYPAAMARRLQALAQDLVAHHDGDTASLWRDVDDGATLHGRLATLPGFGDEKVRIFVALLGKRFGVRPPGWEDACAPFADDQPRSAADVGSRAEFERVKAWKRDMRAKGRGKADTP